MLNPVLKRSGKNFSRLAAAIALVGILPTLALPNLAMAKAIAPVQLAAATQAKPAAPKAKSIWEELNLKPEQKQKIQTIRAARTRAITKELTDAQKAKFEQLRGKMGLGQALKSLNLNASQTKNITAAVKKASDEVIAVLDNNQRDKLSAYLKQKKMNTAE